MTAFLAALALLLGYALRRWQEAHRGYSRQEAITAALLAAYPQIKDGRSAGNYAPGRYDRG